MKFRLVAALCALSSVFFFGGIGVASAAANLSACTQNSDCDSGHCSNDAGAAQGICCPAGTCGWGDGSNNSRECVASDQIRENEWASLVCRNGDWKTRLNGWGCDSPGLACDQGTCQSIGGVYFCRSCHPVDEGAAADCGSNQACPEGTACNYGACCPAGYCGWGSGGLFNRQCVKDGDYRENRWARLVCRNGVWKTEFNGWGCASFACDSGACQNNNCVSSLPFVSPSQTRETAAYCPGTCKSCSAQGKQCGTVSDQCGGWLFCGACASGQVCSEAGQCVAQGVCTAGEVSGCKVCKTDGLGWADDGSKCATGQKCSLGQCVSVPSDSDCTAKTCSSAGYECGAWNDACGGIFDCGACAAGKSCSAAGKCVDGAGTPQTDIKINGDDGPVSAKPNTLITLSWISNNTTACTASGNWSGSKALSGYESIVMSSGSMVFSLSCTGNQGTVSDSITVNAAAFGIGLADSVEISSGATATLSAEITGTAPSSPVYQWSCTGGSLSDSSILSPDYTAPAVTSDKQYVCTLAVRDGSAIVSKKININVKPVSQDVIELEKQIAEIKALIESLQKQLAALAGLPATGAGSAKYSCTQLTKYLIYNTQNDPEIKCLQEFLIAQGFSGVTVDGNYYAATRAAVKAFQEKYAAEILAPYGLTYGSGNVGNDTRRKINALIAAGQ